jgi:hypothetical protein
MSFSTRLAALAFCAGVIAVLSFTWLRSRGDPIQRLLETNLELMETEDFWKSRQGQEAILAQGTNILGRLMKEVTVITNDHTRALVYGLIGEIDPTTYAMVLSNCAVTGGRDACIVSQYLNRPALQKMSNQARTNLIEAWRIGLAGRQTGQVAKCMLVVIGKIAASLDER